MKGERKMNETIVKEASDILKRLSPKNQAYFMTLVRVADAAENGVKNTECAGKQVTVKIA